MGFMQVMAGDSSYAGMSWDDKNVMGEDAHRVHGLWKRPSGFVFTASRTFRENRHMTLK